LSALSPALATGPPCAKTLREPRLTLAPCILQQRPSSQGTSIVCLFNLSPSLFMGIPLANTVNCVAMTGALVVHGCPVLALSLKCLDIAGMPVFMCSENRCRYSLSYRGTNDLQIACRPSFNTLFTLQSYPVIDDNILSSVVFLPLADKLRSTAPLA
jgi:hypothetical protein